MDEREEGVSFNPDDVKELVQESVETTLRNSMYSQGKVETWSSTIIENCLKRLASLNLPFKYIVTCVLMQRTGAGLHSSCAAFWDNAVDGMCNVKWENDTIHCLTTVYGLGI